MENERLLELLIRSITPPKVEENQLDWKISLTEDRKKLRIHISAFANYPGGGGMVFGIDNRGNLVGLSEKDMNMIIGKVANIADQGLEPPIHIEHWKTLYAGKNILFIKIPFCQHGPVHIRGKGLDHSYIRSGGQTRKMSKAELKDAIIRCSPMKFEEIIHTELEIEKVLDFDLISSTLDFQRNKLDFDKLVDLKLAAKTEHGYFPTNLGLICFCKDLTKISGFDRYTIRFIKYPSPSKAESDYDIEFKAGLAKSFPECYDKIIELLPKSERIYKVQRKSVPLYPEKAIREALANAAAHRDYSRSDTRVLVELYPHKLEIMSPGGLLPDINPDRLIDQEPRSRNTELVRLLNRMGLCEERGRGIDIMAMECEIYGLPAVKWESSPSRFIVTFRAPVKFDDMDKEERLYTLYQHTYLNWVLDKKTTNGTLRERFRVDKSIKISRLIKEAIKKKIIKRQNPHASPRWIHYIPYWAEL